MQINEDGRESAVSRDFSGYYNREVPQEDSELTHTGPGTAAGEYLRRYWQPIAMSSEFDKRPVLLKVLGEDLVAFKVPSGDVGLVHKHCPHRGASLEFGQIEANGIRCAYHGWLIGQGGRVLESPASSWACRLVHGAYPTREYRGLIFAYFGPPHLKPEFPIFDTMEDPQARYIPFLHTTPCNWTQIGDNGLDPIHVSFLHMIGSPQFGAAWADVPEIDWHETPVGMVYVVTTRVGDRIYVRSNDTILPNISQGGSNWVDADSTNFFTRASMVRWKVPVDNTATMQIGWRIFNGEIEPEGRFAADENAIGKDKIDLFGQTADGRSYAERQAVPSDFDIIVSQRPIAVHKLEHLGTADRGIVMARRLVRRGIEQAKDPSSDAMVPQVSVRPIPTYAHDTLLSIPAKPGEDDRELLRRIGREVTEIIISSGQREGDRTEHVRARLKTLSG
ncbi:nitrite reductase/ring-hydroxylating ferredoxin subunit [Bradyrhizobium sp. i1.3.1]